jgi:hypothetical protein
MNHQEHIARHLKEVFFGGNWTWSNFQDHLADVDWKQATFAVNELNTIAKLLFHCDYYVEAILGVLNGKPLTSKDEFSWDHPPIRNDRDWREMVDGTFNNVNELIALIKELPESKLWETFIDEKYGNYYRNLNGLIEHSHYHLGQIVMIKKLL